MSAVDDSEITYDARGLVPCVVQDWRTGEVLTLAYMNKEALELTRRTGEMHFFSRSRQELWHKGETSGNTQAVRAIRYDCDGDALLALVEPAGPACHTGERTCFHRGEREPLAPHEVLTLAHAARSASSLACLRGARVIRRTDPLDLHLDRVRHLVPSPTQDLLSDLLGHPGLVGLV